MSTWVYRRIGWGGANFSTRIKITLNILSYKKRGYSKIKIDIKLYVIDKVPEINKKIKHDISVLVDRIIINSDLGNRLAESVESAVNLANGLMFVEYEN